MTARVYSVCGITAMTHYAPVLTPTSSRYTLSTSVPSRSNRNAGFASRRPESIRRSRSRDGWYTIHAVIAVLLASILALCVAPLPPAEAQVFIASRAHPDFQVGPLFVSLAVDKRLIGPHAGPETVNISWSLVPAPGRDSGVIAQDLYLLWPGEIAAAASGNRDAELVRRVQSLGFTVKSAGSVRLSARARTEFGTRAELRKLGDAPFVTFARDDATARAASY